MYMYVHTPMVASSLGGLSKVLVEKFIMIIGGGVLLHDVLQLHCQF